MSNEVTDEQLVARLQAGDESAVALMMDRYHDMVYCLVLKLLNNDRSDAEEITQDTFTRAYRAIGRFRGDSSLKTWLHRIAQNLARNRYWYHCRRRRHLTLSFDAPLGEDGGTLQDVIAGDAMSPAEVEELAEVSAHAKAAIALLEWRHQEVLEMRVTKGFSYEFIAAKLGISIGTVKSRIARAREALRTIISNFDPMNTPFKNNLQKNDRVLDTDSGRQGKVYRTPQSPGQRKTAILFDGKSAPKYLDVMQLRLIVDGRTPEDCPPVEGTPPAEKPAPVSTQAPSALEALKAELFRNAAEMGAIEKRFRALKAANEKLDRAIEALTAA